MKKIVLAVLAAMLSVGAQAQQGQAAVGANLAYPTELKTLGIAVKGWYGFTDAIRAQATFDYYLKKNNVTWWDINLDAHYLFPVGESLKLYPLAGLTYLHSKASVVDVPVNISDKVSAGSSKVSVSNGEFGVNLGGGLQYDLTENLAINVELKYQIIKDSNQGVFSAGIAYKF